MRIGLLSRATANSRHCSSENFAHVYMLAFSYNNEGPEVEMRTSEADLGAGPLLSRVAFNGLCLFEQQVLI